jgi:ABC-2 type transport system ATP-binding protein
MTAGVGLEEVGTSTGTQVEGITKGDGRRPVSRVLSLSVASRQFRGVLRADDADSTTAVDNVEASRRRDGGRNRVRGFDPAEPRERVRHRGDLPSPVL